MGFVAGSFLHSPLPPLPLRSSSSSARNSHTSKSKFRASCCLRQNQDQNGVVSCTNRRTLFFMGISVLPLLRFKATALENDEGNTLENIQKEETALGNDRPLSSSFVALLNVIGLLSSGVLAALYATAQKETTAAFETIHLMDSKLKEKEELIASLKNTYEFKLLEEEEERTKQLGEAKEEQQALISKLSSAEITIIRLEQEVKGEKKLVEELKLQIDSLETILSKTSAEKKDLEEKLKEKVDSTETLEQRINMLNSDLKDKEAGVQNLVLTLAEKESELMNLTSTYEKTKDDLSNAQLQIQELNDELLKSRKELEAKDSLANELNSKVSALTHENDDSRRKYVDMEKAYNYLKYTSDTSENNAARLLREREEELDQLKEQLQLVSDTATANKFDIANLSLERQHLKESLEKESEKVNSLQSELQTTQADLEKSREEASVLEKQLNESNKLQKSLEAEVSNLSSELTEVDESLQRSLEKATQEIQMLTNELRTTMEHLKKTQAELQSKSQELASALENRESLEREVTEIYKKAETTVEDLKEEKKLVASLYKEREALEKQVSNEKEARRLLEVDLVEATNSLEEVNQKAMVLNKQLERANSIISSLENEKETLIKSLQEQRNASKVAEENMEDAQTLIKKLGIERDNLENKGKKFQEELALSKGQILLLKSRVATLKKQPSKDEGESKVPTVNKRTSKAEKESNVATGDEQVPKDEGEKKVTVSARKSSRKRKTNSQ
ncbi:MAR-binding filament-like protein 1-1 isoform X2 [Arachis ipaensis]|uniref:MAR-binding filament-like protein 1-1 isoform X2 n=1 Tax=Arachis ipaensis TaxID=130454 RepID=UPI000A2B6F71|nr:MAR-binding filament-like protein 1-1 isoform X2 [Arachis ipaensis]XP_025678943.1 MAR-binding filament-like protein 1-1 isoform X2 [Arachis hypogaea]